MSADGLTLSRHSTEQVDVDRLPQTAFDSVHSSPLSGAQKIIRDFSSHGNSEEMPKPENSSNITEEAADLLFTCHWSKMTVAHTIVLSRALDGGMFPSDTFLVISAIDCVDMVYNSISNQFRYSFEGWHHHPGGQIEEILCSPEAFPQVLSQAGFKQCDGNTHAISPLRH